MKLQWDWIQVDDSALDLDGDGLTNKAEYQAGTAANKVDTDNDGLSDKNRVDNNMNPLDGSDAIADNDGDGLRNGDEVLAGTNPDLADSDGDGLSDQQEIELEPMQSMPIVMAMAKVDGAEVIADSDPLDAASTFADSDNDGMSDEYETCKWD